MKREVAFVGIGLLAGLGAGYALGIHRTATPAPRPAVERAPSPAAARLIAPAPPATVPGQMATAAPVSDAADARRQLMAWLAAGAQGMERRQVQELLAIWSAADPAAALEFVFRAPRFPWRNAALAVPLATIAGRSPTETADWLRGHLPEQDRGEIAQLVIQQLHKEHPREALVLAEADQVPVGAHFFGMIFGRLVESDPAQALAAFSRLSEGGRQESAYSLAGAWAEADPVAALHWVESLRGQPGAAEAQRGYLLGLSTESPAQTIALLGQWQIDSGLARHIARTVAQRNPELVLNNLEAFPADCRGEALGALVDSSFSNTPDRLAALARASLPDEQAQALVAVGWRRWLAQDRPAAEAWAANVQDPALRSSLELVKLRETAESDPSLFLTTADDLPAAQGERDLVQSALARVNPDQAADWIIRHPTAVTPEFAARIASGYFEWNRDQAVAWVDRLPASPARDQALAGLALRWTETGNAAQASRSLASIADSRLQTASRFQVFSSLHARNQAEAAQWLAAQPLSPEIRANWAALVSTGDAYGSERYN